ncbi:MAG: CehA/McbA family metallohydrolase [Acidobacteriota bacterium]
MIIDLHVHTVDSRDSLIPLEDLIEQALSIGLDAVCLMEHNRLSEDDTAELFANNTMLKIFRGVEVSSDLGHMLVYGITPQQWQLFEGKAQIYAQELVDSVRSWGGVCIPAHPFRFNSPSIGDKISSLVGVFAIEGYNGKTDINENLQAGEVAARLQLKVTGGSDAHMLGQVGKCVTIFDEPIESIEELVTQLKAGTFQARYLF